MSEIVKYILLTGIPMALTQCLYRAIDPDGSKTGALAKKLPILVEKKFLTQIVLPMLLVVVLGFILLLVKIPLAVYFIISGLAVGLINGLAVTLMYYTDQGGSKR